MFSIPGFAERFLHCSAVISLFSAFAVFNSQIDPCRYNCYGNCTSASFLAAAQLQNEGILCQKGCAATQKTCQRALRVF